MSDKNEGKGSCLCGATRIFVKTVSKNIGGCHCQMCRKWGGGPLLVVDCGSEVSFEGQENITTFNSSEWAERAFCKQCGTHLFYRLKQNNQHFIPVGLFEQSPDFVFDHQIFIDEKPTYYCFANETNNLTGAEVFAQFAPPNI
ncbi:MULTISPECIES: GFA family protein [Nostoc]|uniref:GFA family protein n=1 Tax=Nostoc paludosum FACHB-159 TaxID=2692908 RepID=A0ABR8KIB4_9NOSO|nr:MULTISPECIES: GFA family protein [Nostoc]MBD2682953.1 GFA family protein [Nostoc sp. FACHB-857]MBD2739292.1 GFA family protein [Nostoc paludosum FACHB-159]